VIDPTARFCRAADCYFRLGEVLVVWASTASRSGIGVSLSGCCGRRSKTGQFWRAKS